MSKKKILFLHTELAAYFLACIDTLAKTFDAEVHVIKLPVNKEAPFVFSYKNNVKFYDRHDYSDKELTVLCKSISPDFIFCAGWIDASYLKISKYFFKKIPTVIVLDNHWTGSLKQQIAALVSPAFLLRRFSHIWIPGLFQYEYARKLGFKKEVIITGMYSADVSRFQSYYDRYKERKTHSFPKRFLFVGRYIESKGVKELWEAFVELQTEMPSAWELWCAGTGKLESSFPKHPKIKNLGFIQTEAFESLISDTGVFVLPSHYDPWGVVVHEFAACGMPLVCSHDVGAGASFLINGYNGYTFPSKNKNALKKALLRTMSLSDKELLQMSERSVTLSSTITPLTWATKIWELARNNDMK
jgi:glycosyltransferase involved in cell wall biosynthesis